MAAEALAQRVRDGDHAAVARMLTMIERRTANVNAALAELHGVGGHAHVIGITGPPGSGKSTLVSSLTQAYRANGKTVGIIAVDPSSVFSGGAILGDRIRMSDLAGDRGVFIRSLATRGALGGLSRAALDAITVLDAAGKDVVILETVGVGQAEVDVITAAESVVVVSVPGMGDGVQAIKAGLLEVADIHVVNKSDRDGADRTVAELREMLRLVRHKAGQWRVPIHQTVAADGTGVTDLTQLLAKHRHRADVDGEREQRARRNSAARIRWLAEERIVDQLRSGATDVEQLIDDVTVRNSDPMTAARTLVRRACDNDLTTHESAWRMS